MKKNIIDIKGRKIGGNHFLRFAGPCAIESRENIFEIAKIVKKCGGDVLRGGGFKPRTSPYDFQGLGEIGLKYMKEAAEKYDLLVASEIMDKDDIDMMNRYVDIFQVGARNMQNFSLLKALGKVQKPVLLKRGMSATVHEFLMAAEYIIYHGNPNVILCERGIRTFETATRNTLDINAIPLIKLKSTLPIVIDASHGTGVRDLVIPITLAGLMAGADGMMVEIHPEPEKALSDGPQSLYFEDFKILMKDIKKTIEFRNSLNINKK